MPRGINICSSIHLFISTFHQAQAVIEQVSYAHLLLINLRQQLCRPYAGCFVGQDLFVQPRLQTHCCGVQLLYFQPVQFLHSTYGRCLNASAAQQLRAGNAVQKGYLEA